MKPERKNFGAPDEIRTPHNTKIEIVTVGGNTVMKTTFMPGWKWSQDIKPMVGGEVCQAHHFGYQISGTLHVAAAGGEEIESEAGDVVDIPPGHDAWVMGDVPVVLIDFGDVEHRKK